MLMRGGRLRRLFPFHRKAFFVLLAQIVPETHNVCGKLGLLDLDDDMAFFATPGSYQGGEIQSVDGDGDGAILDHGDRFLGQEIQRDDFFFQDGGEDQDGDLVVLHQILEDHVVDGVGYSHGFCASLKIGGGREVRFAEL